MAAAIARAGGQGSDNAGVKAAESAVEQARINLAFAEVRAPAAGWIANLSLRKGQAVSPYVPLFSLVEDKGWWIDANFKETDLARIRPSQKASVQIDMYPGVTLEGSVRSLGAGSGAVFSLLPPQNAAGNWVKVTQRFPVRISLDQLPTDPAIQMRVGASVTVTVDTISPSGKLG